MGLAGTLREMSTFEQLRDCGEDPIATFEHLFFAALAKLLPDLAEAPWYVREREVVNLFVFEHLIPQFEKKNLDIGQLGIEVPVLKLPKAKLDKPEEVEISQIASGPPILKSAKRPKETVGKYADIVVWPHNKATRWRTCRPLAHIEWKNISCLEKNGRELERQHDKDIGLLKHNQELVCVSYAALTDQRDKHVELRCTRIVDGKEPEDFFSPSSRVLPAGIVAYQKVLANRESVWCLRCEATYPDKTLADLPTYKELSITKQGSACEDCSSRPKPASSVQNV